MRLFFAGNQCSTKSWSFENRYPTKPKRQECYIPQVNTQTLGTLNVVDMGVILEHMTFDRHLELLDVKETNIEAQAEPENITCGPSEGNK